MFYNLIKLSRGETQPVAEVLPGVVRGTAEVGPHVALGRDTAHCHQEHEEQYKL